jgi:hypothetical protein
MILVEFGNNRFNCSMMQNRLTIATMDIKEGDELYKVNMGLRQNPGNHNTDSL